MREEFERWYLQVVKGHPNNLTKDERGGYKYLAAMYLGWEAATMIEREKCAKTCEELRAKWINEEAGDPDHTVSDFLACANAIRERSNCNVTGAEPAGGASGGRRS